MNSYTPENIKDKGDQQKKENTNLVKFLKRKKQNTLDDVTHALHDEAFEHIDCLTCANCCTTTSPIFTDIDINRIAKALKMKSIQFIETYLQVDADGDYVLQTAPCTFLGHDNYCSIYEHRPKACREYPHTNRKRFYQILDLSLKNTFICPAVQSVFDGLKEEYL